MAGLTLGRFDSGLVTWLKFSNGYWAIAVALVFFSSRLVVFFRHIAEVAVFDLPAPNQSLATRVRWAGLQLLFPRTGPPLSATGGQNGIGSG